MAQRQDGNHELISRSRDQQFLSGDVEAGRQPHLKLNHFALSWDNTGKLCTPTGGASSCFVGPTNIREEIVLDRRGNAYSGTVTIDQYDAANHWMFRLTGTVSAHRITAG